MTTNEDLAWLDATAQAELVRTKEVTPAELVAAAIERIERVDPQVNSVIHRRFERALEEAGDGGELPDGPFRGVPFVVKDLYAATAGDPMHNGMRALRDAQYVAPADSWLTARYRSAGFVFVGRTNTPELGLVPTTEPEAYGATRNPWSAEHTAGRLERRERGGRRRRARPCGPRQRRRRVHPHPRLHVRARRAQGVEGPHHPRTGSRRVGAQREPRRDPFRPRLRGDPRRHRRVRSR